MNFITNIFNIFNCTILHTVKGLYNHETGENRNTFHIEIEKNMHEIFNRVFTFLKII